MGLSSTSERRSMRLHSGQVFFLSCFLVLPLIFLYISTPLFIQKKNVFVDSSAIFLSTATKRNFHKSNTPNSKHARHTRHTRFASLRARCALHTHTHTHPQCRFYAQTLKLLRRPESMPKKSTRGYRTEEKTSRGDYRNPKARDQSP